MNWFKRFLAAVAGDEGGPPTGDPAEIAAVQQVIDSLRPMLVADGGDIRIVSVADGWVSVRLLGACRTCHASPMTIRGALEPKLRAEHPWVKGIRVV